jgi:hypothetical protein
MAEDSKGKREADLILAVRADHPSEIKLQRHRLWLGIVSTLATLWLHFSPILAVPNRYQHVLSDMCSDARNPLH